MSDLYMKIKRESRWYIWRNIRSLGRNQVVLAEIEGNWSVLDLC